MLYGQCLSICRSLQALPLPLAKLASEVSPAESHNVSSRAYLKMAFSYYRLREPGDIRHPGGPGLVSCSPPANGVAYTSLKLVQELSKVPEHPRV